MRYLYLRKVNNLKWNHKRINRIYQELELNLLNKPRKLLVCDKQNTLDLSRVTDQVWPINFMYEYLEDGRSICLFNVIDDFIKEPLGIEMGFSSPSERTIDLSS